MAGLWQYRLSTRCVCSYVLNYVFVYLCTLRFLYSVN